jgi:hypothetical protein
MWLDISSSCSSSRISRCNSIFCMSSHRCRCGSSSSSRCDRSNSICSRGSCCTTGTACCVPALSCPVPSWHVLCWCENSMPAQRRPTCVAFTPVDAAVMVSRPGRHAVKVLLCGMHSSTQCAHQALGWLAALAWWLVVRWCFCACSSKGVHSCLHDGGCWLLCRSTAARTPMHFRVGEPIVDVSVSVA